MICKEVQRRLSCRGQVAVSSSRESKPVKCCNQTRPAYKTAMYRFPGVKRNFSGQESSPFAEQGHLRNADRPLPEYCSRKTKNICPFPQRDCTNVTDHVIRLDFALIYGFCRRPQGKTFAANQSLKFRFLDNDEIDRGKQQTFFVLCILHHALGNSDHLVANGRVVESEPFCNQEWKGKQIGRAS